MREKICSFGKTVRKNRVLLLMLLPAALFVIIFSYIPMAGIVVAFKNFNYQDGIFGSPFNELDNFQYLFVTNKIWSLTRNTLLYNVAFILLGMLFEVGFAIILSEIGNKVFKKFAQGFMFLPYFISWVVVSTIMLNIFGDNGVLNGILSTFGIEDFSVYKNIGQWPVVMVLVRLWKQTGYGAVIYLAAIAGISADLYEAADIDGANVWQKNVLSAGRF